MDRRRVLIGAGAWSALGASAIAGGGPGAVFAQAPGDAVETVTADHVKGLAERLARTDFVKPRIDPPAPFGSLTYDQYRDIRFRPEKSIWREEKLGYEVQLFPIGFLYDIPVDVWIVDGGTARLLKADGNLFSMGPLVGANLEGAPFAFSGFRIHGPLNRSDYYDEFVLFQGASYFRATGRNQIYGLSARGLAIGTARPGGEEFPIFRAFWIEKPAAGASSIVVHALLDSPSTAGAYKFTIQPGAATVMDVDMTLYPRRPLSHIGVAPLTSMFLRGAASHRVEGDFRPNVHDSDGLAIVNGRNERLWRPLANPKTLQASAFMDKDCKGFGLSQRDRSFFDYEDLEARYERRPSVWVEPKGGWGDGSVELIEIPADEEIHDNIVAYWKPAGDLAPGAGHAFGYRLYWAQEPPAAWAGARVRKTFVTLFRSSGASQFVVDFDGPGLADLADLPFASLEASGGRVSNLTTRRHPEIAGVRVAFELDPGGTDLIELRLGLKVSGRLISESWLYRWTQS